MSSWAKNVACRLPGKGVTNIAKYYVALLDKLKQELASKHWGKLSKVILFLRDYAVPHKVAIKHQKLANLHSEVLKHPDLFPSDYYLFPTFKKQLSGGQFLSNEDATLAVDG